MDYIKTDSMLALRLDPGEEVLESLLAVCRKEDIRFGTITGIGAIGEVELGLFDPATKEYHKSGMKEDLEIISLLGNITDIDGDVYLHCHITVSNHSCQAFGGHLNRAVVSATTEIFVHILPGGAKRVFSDKIGLNLMEF